MLGPLARSRALVGAAALLTAAASSIGFASDTSATSGSASAPAVRAPFVGPVAAPVPPRPLVRTDGPLLLPALARVPVRLVHRPRPMGPFVAAAPAPSAVTDIGPDSPVAQVRAVQRLLNARGAELRVDGAWGPATTAAVRRLQAQAGLPVDGRIGAATAAALGG